MLYDYVTEIFDISLNMTRQENCSRPNQSICMCNLVFVFDDLFHLRILPSDQMEVRNFS